MAIDRSEFDSDPDPPFEPEKDPNTRHFGHWEAEILTPHSLRIYLKPIYPKSEAKTTDQKKPRAKSHGSDRRGK
jgi:hypothetical protein